MEVSLINSNKSFISADLNSAKLELVQFLQLSHYLKIGRELVLLLVLKNICSVR